MPTHDNDAEPDPMSARDAHGQAALVLVESLIHGLLERSVLTVADAVEIIDVASDIQADVAEAADGAGAKMWRSHSLLAAMSSSLARDLNDPNRAPF